MSATSSRLLRRPLFALAATPLRYALWSACLLLASCGGGGDSTPPPPPGPTVTSFTADQPSYFVGGVAKLTAVFQGGSGRIDPGNIAVTSGQTISTPTLTDDVVYKLTVSNGTSSATRELAMDVSYRERMRSLTMPFARFEHAAATLPDGRVLIIGGDSFGNTLPTEVYQFNPATEAFSKFADLSTGRAAMVAVTLANGDVLVALGGTALSEAPPAEIINGTTGAVTPTLGRPAHVRYYATATLLADGRVLIAGGTTGTHADPSAEIFDPSTGQFTIPASMMTKGRYSHSATRLDDGRVLIYGGYTDDQQPAPPELFDAATSSFAALAAPEGITRAIHSAVKTRDGRVWILGGEDNASNPLVSVLRFDQETFFALGPNLAVPRTMLGAAALADGRLMLAGGARTYDGDEFEAGSELVSNLQSRVNGPAMSGPRVMHTVTALGNGKVLIAGGYSRAGGALSTAEIFE